MLMFKRGDTPTFKVTLNTPIDMLGDPRCVLVQDDHIAYLDTVMDVDENCIYCTLNEEDSILFVGDFTAMLQHVWMDEAENAIAFPPTEVFVEQCYIPLPDFDEMGLELDPEAEENLEGISDDDIDLDEDSLTNEGDAYSLDGFEEYELVESDYEEEEEEEEE